jgi:L-alanine-DL-glutamate epimerase-like enolase superfamily enzyme
MEVYITAVRPKDVAEEVQRWMIKGCRNFVLRQVADGGMLDLERLGAARYAAGLHAEVVLETEAALRR